MNEVYVTTHKQEELIRFLELNSFEVDDLGAGIFKIVRDNELPVFMRVDANTIYFEVDLGDISGLDDKKIYFKLLDMNTEILPVSFGINNTNPADPRLVLVESRVTGDLNNHELLSVFDALELAVDRAEALLADYIK